ncbi:MAG TPA: ABC-F family ATP-binding cassette domain-containing protein, partial [Symbiobacteriaceae bacterium]|nr:ABC-F family ATP-binding cassette domain-containing protein [Symbiobacteriaceae bacterium]
MNIVSVEKIAKTYGEKRLFADLSFGIAEGARIALIGVNGSGKSTLLQIVAGLVQPDQGQVVTRNGLTIEYLAQAPQFDPTATVLQTVFQGENAQIRTLRAYEETLEQLNEHPEDQRIQSRLAELQTQMDAGGVWALEAQAKSILNRLGITGFTRPVGELSGGQRKRVAMARALIQPADLLILDEPTNHIDNETVAWLEEYLASYKGALLLITHDRYFLDRVVNQIVELDRGRLVSYEGNYGAYLEQKAEREVTEIAQEERRQNLLRRELHWLRQGAKARTTKQKARIQRAEKLVDERPEAKGGQVEIAVSAHRLGRRIIEVQDVSRAFQGRPVIRNFTYNLLPGDRIGIIGPNGAGKSTLLNLIAGRITPDSGEVLTGGTVRLAYYDQESSAMDPDQKVIDYIKDVAEVIKLPDGGTITAAQMLERFLFPAKVQWTEIGKLSGGERRRLYLCRTLMAEPNVLLLDEPTNDLDIQTLTILEEFLDGFPGVVVAVSHDRYFLDRMAEHLFAFEGEG